MTVRVAVPIEINDSNLEASGISEPDTLYGEQAWQDESARSLMYSLDALTGNSPRYCMTRTTHGELIIVIRTQSGAWGAVKFSTNNTVVWVRSFSTDTGISNASLSPIGCGVDGNALIIYWFVQDSGLAEHKNVYEQRLTGLADQGPFPISYTSSAIHISGVPSKITDSTFFVFTRSNEFIFSSYSSNSLNSLQEVNISRLSLDGSEQSFSGAGVSSGNAVAITSDSNGGVYVLINNTYANPGEYFVKKYSLSLENESSGKVPDNGISASEQISFYNGVIDIGAPFGGTQINITPYSQSYINFGSYKKDDEVIYLPNHTKYICLANETFSNPSETATEDENAEWLKIGLSNRWAMFDGSVSYASLFGGNKSVTIDPSTDYDTVGCIGVDGMSLIRLDILDQSGSLLYREDKSATNPDPEFLDFNLTEIVFTEIPPFSNAKVKVSFFVDGSGESKVGEFIVGKSYELGKAVTGTQSNTKDFSEQREDQFGNFEYIERAIVPSVTYQVDVAKDKSIAVQRFVNSLRGKSNLWYADIGEPEFLTVYGRCETIPMTYENHSIVSYKAKVRGTI